MKRRIILSGHEARTALAKGAEKLAKMVGSTCGPFGHNFFLDKKNTITNDGVTVAREIQLPDEVENRGAVAIREAAIKTVEEVGDGTSTAALLAYAIYAEASKYLGKQDVAAKKTGSEITRQIETERKEITDKLIAMATPIETKEQLVSSAIVSTESTELGTLIGEAQFQVGKEGYLLAEESAERISSLEIEKGIRIDNGYGTSMVINNIEKQALELKEIPVLLTSHTIRDFRELAPRLDQLLKTGKSQIVIIARAWTETAINLCQQNHKNGFAIYPLNAPYYDMQERFKDLAAVTGATFYDSEDSELSDISLGGIGYAEKVVARRFDAIITGKDDDATKQRVLERLTELTAKQAGSQSDFEKKGIMERIAQLNSGFGIIKVGSPSDIERRRLFDKADDAVHAVRAAYQEGTVPGAGIAFKTIADGLDDSYLLKRPLYALYEQIMATAPKGFVIEDWVRDPVKVLRVALEKACAVASSFATAGGVITEQFQKPLDEMMRTNAPQAGDE